MSELTPARQRLAAAQAAHDRLSKTTQEQRDQAFAVLDGELNELGRDYEAALTALETAKRRIVSPGRVAVQRALGQPIPQTVEAAQRAVDEVREKMGDINRQRELARGEFDRVRDNEVELARYAVKQSIAEVLCSEGIVDALMRRRMELLVEANAIRNAIRVISFAVPTQQNLVWQTYPHIDAFPPDSSVSAAYVAAVKALETDPAAVLPDLPPEPARQPAAEAA